MQTRILLLNDISELRDHVEVIGFSPMVPNTTHGNVFPNMNSRMLVMSSKSPPKNTIGPLFASIGFNPTSIKT